jgi:hypothetical protein
MLRLLSFLATVLLLSTSAAKAASPLAGNGTGRALLSGENLGSFFGIAQQSISGFNNSGGRISSNIIVGSTPLALEITDHIGIARNRVTFQTNFTIASGNDAVVTLTGHARVSKKTIRYSASSSDGTLQIQGVIRLNGHAVTRTETRQDSGSTYTIRTTVYP